MTTTVQELIQSGYAPNAQTTAYTSTSVRTIIDKYTVQNNSGGPVTYAVNLVPSGGSAGASNLILSRTIQNGETYTCPELVGHVLNPGGFISHVAGSASALVVKASGRVIS